MVYPSKIPATFQEQGSAPERLGADSDMCPRQRFMGAYFVSFSLTPMQASTTCCPTICDMSFAET